MKRSYKLLGIYLDRREIPKHMPLIKEQTSSAPVQRVTEPDTLFDFALKTRRLSGSELLTYECFSDITKCIDQLEHCIRVVIVLDFVSSTRIANILYMKRLFQLLQLLKENYPNIDFSFSCDCGRKSGYTRTLQLIYGQ